MQFASIVLAGALALGTVSAPAAAQQFVPDEIKKSVVNEDLAAVVGALGHQVLEQGEGGNVLVLAENQDQIKYVLLGTACDTNGVTGCQGVLMQAQFELPITTSYETVAQANLQFSALNVWVDFEQKSLGFTRYVVLDEGVTMANLRANVEVLMGLLGDAYPVASGEPVAAEPEAAPAS
ncbi:MAG: YbjN domain-containing protein [Erythrobacter sp.]|nr:YbjN domain-containing protein [Erythrobacter sp.]